MLRDCPLPPRLVAVLWGCLMMDPSAPLHPLAAHRSRVLMGLGSPPPVGFMCSACAAVQRVLSPIPKFCSCTGGVHCLFRSPVPVSVPSMPPVTLLSSGPSPLPWAPAAAGSPTDSSVKSKPYLCRTIAPCLGLAPSAPSECLCVLTCDFLPLPPSAVPHVALGGASISCPPTISSP